MRRINPLTLAATGIGIVVLVIAALLLARRDSPDQSSVEPGREKSAGIEAKCASQATFDRIKVELFRQAAQLRKNDQGAFDRLSAYASVRVERPVLRGRDAELGTVRCGGRLSLDLPPGLAVVGGRRTLSADIDYVLQPAADGSGDVIILEGADPIIIPLATLAQTGTAAPLPAPPPAEDPEPAGQAPLPGPESEPPATEVAEPPAVQTVARPSFNCRYARTRSEIAVCSDPDLAALDRQMARQYYRAVAAADRRQRAILTRTRDSFLRYRDRCPNAACIAETYRGRMREIRDIMSGDWRPER